MCAKKRKKHANAHAAQREHGGREDKIPHGAQTLSLPNTWAVDWKDDHRGKTERQGRCHGVQGRDGIERAGQTLQEERCKGHFHIASVTSGFGV